MRRRSQGKGGRQCKIFIQKIGRNIGEGLVENEIRRSKENDKIASNQRAGRS